MPLLDRPGIVLAAIVYLLATLFIGGWAMRRTRTPADFFVAGRNLGLLVTAIATMSAAFSGFAFLGGPGLTYRTGLASLFICFPVGFTAAMLCWTVARPLRLLAELRTVYTVPDVVFARYRSRTASGLAAMAVLVGTVFYLGTQLLALGVMLEAILGTRGALGASSLPAAIALGALVIVFYCTAGGMVASVYTDLLQGVIMAVAGALVFVQALHATGGWSAMTHSLATSPHFGEAFLDPLGKVNAFTAFGFYFVFGVGVAGQPHVIHKFFMLRAPAELRYFPLVLGGSQVLCILLWLGVGLAVPALVAQGRLAPLASPDETTPAFLLGFSPEWLAGLVFAGVLAAIMSTASSLVNIAAAAVVRDLPRALRLRRAADELRAGRAMTVVVVAAAGASAWLSQDLIALLGAFSFGTLAAALTPALVIGLNWRRVTSVAAAASIGCGLVLNLALEFLARQTYLSSLPRPPFAAGVQVTAVSLAASFVVLMAVTSLTREERLDEAVAAAMEA
jgi:SSS family transporter